MPFTPENLYDILKFCRYSESNYPNKDECVPIQSFYFYSPSLSPTLHNFAALSFTVEYLTLSLCRVSDIIYF